MTTQNFIKKLSKLELPPSAPLSLQVELYNLRSLYRNEIIEYETERLVKCFYKKLRKRENEKG